MAFRLPSQKKFKPNINKATVPRKASIPASLAKPSTPAGPSGSGTPVSRPPIQSQASASGGEPGAGAVPPSPTPAPGPAIEDGGLPPGIGSLGSAPESGTPAFGSSQTQTQTQTQSQTQIQTPGTAPGTFREPSLPPSRKRAASPTPSNASRSSRTGGRPTLIHLAASSGPARRPTPAPSPSPSPAPAPALAAAGVNPPGTEAEPVPAPTTAQALPTSTPTPAPAPAPAPITAPPPNRAPAKSTAPPPRSPLGRPIPPRQPTPSAPASQRIPSPTPPPSSFTSGPPTIGSSQIPMPPGGQGTPPPQSSLYDPQLLDQTPGAGPSRSPPSPPPARVKSTAELTRELVAGIASLPPGKKVRKINKNGQPRKAYSKRAPRAKKGKEKEKDGDGDGGTEDGSETRASASVTPGPDAETRAGSEATNATAPAPKPRKRPRQKTPEYDEKGNRIRRARGPYKSRGRANTEHDRRLSKFRQERDRQSRSVSVVPASADGDDVDPFADDIPIDPELLKMGSFASNFYDGDMTERAVLLRTTQKTKREESQREKLEFERMKRIRLQPLRRRERAKRNEERAQRRVEWEANGAPEGDEEVSDDEIDSTDEEYEFEPDRLTPPGTPEPQYEQEGEGDGEEQEGVRPDERNPDEDDEEEGLGLDPNANYGEGSEYDEELEPETREMDFAAHGIDIVDDAEHEQTDQTANQGPADPNEPDPDYAALFDINPGADEDEEHEGYEDGGPGFSFADYTANMETRREQALANQNSRFVVQEDDDETRMVNSISWQKRERTDKWTDDETDFFYSVLGEVGENYTMMKAFFPGRSVAQIKKKGLRENAKNPEKVTAAINARRPIDNTYLMKSAGYDPDRPWDKEEALFAEAKRDMKRLRAEDRGEVVDEVGDPDDEDQDRDQDREFEMGDETLEYDQDHVDGEEGEGQDEEIEVGEAEAGEEEGEIAVEGETADGETVEAGQEGLFLPGAETP